MTSFVAMALLGALALGWLTGRRYQRAHRAWSEYHTTKRSLSALRVAAWAATRPATGFLAFAIVVAGYAFYLMVSEQR